MRSIRNAVAPLLLALCLGSAGCSLINWTRVTLNQPLNRNDVAFIKPGTTTFDDVVQNLGAPTSLSGAPNGMRASYWFYDARSFGFDLGSAAGYFLPPGASLAPHSMAYGSDTAGAHTFEVFFDHKGIVQYDGFNRSARASNFTTSPF